MTASTAATALCAWCREPFVRIAGGDEVSVYCSRLNQDWADAVAMGKYPLVECPRCGCSDLRVAAPDWGFCQTCGYLTDRPDLEVGRITPKKSKRGISYLRNNLAAYPIEEE